MKQNKQNQSALKPSLAAMLVKYLRKHKIYHRFIGVYDGQEQGHPNPNVGQSEEDILRRAAADFEAGLVIINGLAILINRDEYERVRDLLYRWFKLVIWPERHRSYIPVFIRPSTRKLICWCCGSRPRSSPKPKPRIHEIEVIKIKYDPQGMYARRKTY